MSFKNWKSGHYGSYEDPYSIRFSFYKSGRPKMPDNHVAIDLDDEVAIGRLYHEGLIVDSEAVETVQWGPRRRVGFFPLTFEGIGELGCIVLDQRFGFDFQTIDLFDLGDTTIRGPGMRKTSQGTEGN